MKKNLLLVLAVLLTQIFPFASFGADDKDKQAGEEQLVSWGQLPSSVQRALTQQNLRDDIVKITMQDKNHIVSYYIFGKAGDQIQVIEATITGKMTKLDAPPKTKSKPENLLTWKEVPANVQQTVATKANRDIIRKIVKASVTIDDKDPTTPDKKVPAYVVFARNLPAPLFVGEDASFLQNAVLTAQKAPAAPVVEKVVPLSQLPGAVQQSLKKENLIDSIYKITAEQQGTVLNYRIRTFVNNEKIQYISNIEGKLTKIPLTAEAKAKPPSGLTWSQVPDPVQKTILAKADRNNVRKIVKAQIDDDDPNSDTKVAGYVIDVVHDGADKELNVDESGKFIAFLPAKPKQEDEDAEKTEKLLTWNDLGEPIKKVLTKTIKRDDLQVIIAEGKSKSRMYHIKTFANNQIQDLKVNFVGKIKAPLAPGEAYGTDPLLTWSQLTENIQKSITEKASRDDIRRMFKTVIDRQPDDPPTLPEKIPVILVEVDKPKAAVKELVLFEDGKFKSFMDKPETDEERMAREQEEEEEEQAAQEAEEAEQQQDSGDSP